MDKKWIPGWLLVGQLLLFACYDETNTYGDNLVESAFRNVMVDTCTVTVTSTVIDSLETTGQGLALVGCYTHPSWGTVSASAYLPYMLLHHTIPMPMRRYISIHWYCRSIIKAIRLATQRNRCG